jgi:hypothetical protein
MALSVVDLYRDVLPKTNCGDCGFPTCLAFAGMVVSEKHPLRGCPHLAPNVVERCSAELDLQYSDGKWTKRDMAEDALKWAKERSASMELKDLPDRIGGEVLETDSGLRLKLDYFNGHVVIGSDDIVHSDGKPLTRWEKVFIYNHMAQGGAKKPTGEWKGFGEFPNTVSKVKTMSGQVEKPLVDQFHGRVDELKNAAVRIGGKEMTGAANSSDVSMYFRPLPRLPVLLLFWDEDLKDGFTATAKLLFDETATDHLDIESMVFLGERLRQLLCDKEIVE